MFIQILSSFSIVNLAISFVLSETCEKEWPQSIKLPTDCCQYPQFVTPTIKRICYLDCSLKTDKCCGIKCVLDKLDIIKSNKVDEPMLRKVMVESINSIKLYVKIIDDIIAQCQDNDNEATIEVCGYAKYSIDYLECVYNRTMTKCPMYMPIAGCDKTKAFIEKCPQLIPSLFNLTVAN